MNITHSEAWPAFLSRYAERSPQMAPLLQAFDAQALRQWIHDLGIETFIGSSGRVFPTDMKAAPCYAPGSSVCASAVRLSTPAIAGWVGRQMAHCVSPARKVKNSSGLMPYYWPWAAAAGPAWARMGRGCRGWPSAV